MEEQSHVHKSAQQTLDAVRFDSKHIGDIINSIVADKFLEIMPNEPNKPLYKTSISIGGKKVYVADIMLNEKSYLALFDPNLKDASNYEEIRPHYARLKKIFADYASLAVQEYLRKQQESTP